MASGDHHDLATRRHGQDSKREPRLWALGHWAATCKEPMPGTSWREAYTGNNFSLYLWSDFGMLIISADSFSECNTP